MLHFPPDFPADAIAVIVPIVRSGFKVTDKIAAGEAALTVQAYAMGQVLGTKPAFGATEAGFGLQDVEAEDERVLSALEAAVRNPRPQTMYREAVGAFPIPPRVLAQWAIKVLVLIAGAL